MTSDGIRDCDWDQVKDLAAKIANAACRNDQRFGQVLTRRLFQLLRTLESRYGPKPSILATKADYVPSRDARIRLLKRAWSLALSAEDKPNLTWIAGSLAEVFIDDLRDRRRGEAWLSRLERALSCYWDD